MLRYRARPEPVPFTRSRVYEYFTENILDDQLIILLQLAESAPNALPIRYGILLSPAAACILVEILAGISGIIYTVDYGRCHCHAVLREAMRAVCNNFRGNN